MCLRWSVQHRSARDGKDDRLFKQQDDDRQIHPAWGPHAGGLVVYI